MEKLTTGEKLRRIGELREQERYEKSQSKRPLPSVADLRKKFNLREQSTENLSPELNKILNLAKTSEDDKKRVIDESANAAKKNVQQMGDLNESFGRILSAQIRTTGLLNELLQTVKNNKEEESAQRKSWFSRLVDATVGALAIGGVVALGAAAMNRANEIDGAANTPPVPPADMPPQNTTPQTQTAPARQATPQRGAEMRKDSMAEQPSQTAAMEPSSSSLSMLASYRAPRNDNETTLAELAAPQSFPKEPASSPLTMSLRVRPKNDVVNATPLYNDDITSNPNAPTAEAINRPPANSSVLRDLPASMRDYTFKANQIRFKADEFKFEQEAVPTGAAEPAMGSNALPASMPVPQLGGGSAGGGTTPAPPGDTGPPSLATVRASNGRGAQVAADRQVQFQGFINELESTGYQIRDLGGYANRNIRDGNTRSAHADGMAIDINPAQNPFRTTTTDMPPNVRDIARRWGLGWGMDFRSVDAQGPRTDPMHFSAAPNEGGSAPTAIPASPNQTRSATVMPVASQSTPPAPAAPAPMPSPQAQVGPALAAASAQRSMSMDMPAPPAPTVVQMSAPDDTGSAPPGIGGPQYPMDPNDPGPVEPSNALQRYSRLFDMAA